MAETWRSNFVTEEDIDPLYIESLVTELVPIVESITGSPSPLHSVVLESTIYKVLIYINNDKLPRPLFLIVAEMSARQLSEYSKGLTSNREPIVKRVQRGGFTQDMDTSSPSQVIPRGTQFMQDYVKYLNRFRRMRIL